MSIAGLYEEDAVINQSLKNKLDGLCEEGVFLSSWSTDLMLTPGYRFCEIGVVLFDEADEAVFIEVVNKP